MEHRHLLIRRLCWRGARRKKDKADRE